MATLLADGMRIEGWSQAGTSTWFRVSPPGIAFDVGRGSVRLSGVNHFFLSHSHLDHALGLPFVLSYRGWQQGAPASIYCPRGIGASLERFLSAAAELEAASFSYQIVELEPGERAVVDERFFVEPFATDHVVPSLGYHLFERRKQLREELKGLSSQEIGDRKRAGEEVDTVRERLMLSYCGDTGPATLDRDVRLHQTPILLLECTFLGEGTGSKAVQYKHMHFDDLIARQSLLQNDTLALIHLSRRHTAAELRQRVDRDLPELADRIVIFPAECRGTASGTGS